VPLNRASVTREPSAARKCETVTLPGGGAGGADERVAGAVGLESGAEGLPPALRCPATAAGEQAAAASEAATAIGGRKRRTAPPVTALADARGAGPSR